MSYPIRSFQVKKSRILFSSVLILLFFSACSKKSNEPSDPKAQTYPLEKFCMGADLSYINQVEDHGGVFYDSSEKQDPFLIFNKYGCNLVRVRLWHHPLWTKEVYGASGSQMYSDLLDAEKTIRRAREAGMGVNLDIHYSDTWADPSHQDIPAAWRSITGLEVLKDSVYQYTYNVLRYLDSKGLMPEMVQVGNEINCGMMMTNIPSGFPQLNGCDNHWQSLGVVINAGIRAVRDASTLSERKPEIILHVADPVNVEWWFDKIKQAGNVKDFDIIGFSYYPLWHTEVSFNELQAKISKFKSKYFKKVMIVETAYPWNKDGSDNFNNLFGSQSPLQGFPFTEQGQLNFMNSLTQKVISAGGSGVMVWEPAWITSGLVTQWGTGSAWENTTFFNFNGNVLPAFQFMTHPYTFPE
jgi:arabinogalactan endo-1,4-beta-galactosidase